MSSKSSNSAAAATPRFASLYKNLKPSVLASSIYSLRKEKVAAKTAAIKAAEFAVASRIVHIMAMKAHDVACKNAHTVSGYDCDYDSYSSDIDYIYENDW